MPTLHEIAKMCLTTVRQDYCPGDSVLFEELYNGFARLAGEQKDFGYHRNRAESLVPKIGVGIYKAACQRMAAWYRATYAVEVSEGKKSGISRAVGNQTLRGEKDYRFDEPISDNLFFSYLIEGKPLNTSDARDFILHTSVAFKLSPTSLDRILTEYGFHPLHVKNVHHMAIYAVLKDIESGNLPIDTDPFVEVKTFFDAAKEILISGETCNTQRPADSQQGFRYSEDGAFATGSTRVIRGYIAGQKNMTRDRVLSYIRNHPEVYRMRHDRLLAEHKRMVDLYSELYKQRQTKKMHPEDEPDEEFQYWLFNFLNNFCKPIESKHFNDVIYRKISEDDRHPTRELMIILWIYSYCFLFLPEVGIYNKNGDGRSFGNLTPFSRGNKNPPVYPFRAYIKNPAWFKVYDYLSDEKVSSSPLFGFPEYENFQLVNFFDGNMLIEFINKKLISYSWRVLDDRIPFDGIIASFGKLSIRWTDGGITSADYGTQRITDVNGLIVENVPVPLVLISKLLDRIKELENESLPLQCDFYEQV